MNVIERWGLVLLQSSIAHISPTLQACRHPNMKFICLPFLLVSHFVSTVACADNIRIDLGDFKIDQTEVSIGRFAEYADRRQIKTAAEKEGGGFEYFLGWQRRPGWSWRMPFGVAAQPNEPAVHINWYEAQAFCQDAGGSLPTLAQWSSAAYTEKRANPPEPFVKGKTYPYPTGENPKGANVEGAEDGWPRHAPVGATKQGVNGLYDMGANAWEWLADAQANTRLTAGGSWWYGPTKMQRDGMQYKAADLYVVYVGFRCVY